MSDAELVIVLGAAAVLVVATFFSTLRRRRRNRQTIGCPMEAGLGGPKLINPEPVSCAGGCRD